MDVCLAKHHIKSQGLDGCSIRIIPPSHRSLAMSSNPNLNNPHLTMEHPCPKVRVALRKSTVRVVNQDLRIQGPAFVEVSLSIHKQSQRVESRLHKRYHKGGEMSLSFLTLIYLNRRILWKVKPSSGHRNRWPLQFAHPSNNHTSHHKTLLPLRASTSLTILRNLGWAKSFPPIIRLHFMLRLPPPHILGPEQISLSNLIHLPQ